MKKPFHKLLVVLVSAMLTIPVVAFAEYYQASGNPANRSTISSAIFRTEFAAIETGITDKLPAYTGNADKIIVVNSGGTGLTVAATGIAITQGGTGATTAGGALTALGAQPVDADLTTYAGITPSANIQTFLGAADYSAMRTQMTLVAGTDVQAYDADLLAIAALAKTDSNFMVGDGAAWVLEDAATAATSLGLGTGDSPQLTGIELGHASDSTLTRAAAGEIELEGRPMIVHDNGAYVGGRIIVTGTTPVDVTGMDSGDMKFVY